MEDQKLTPDLLYAQFLTKAFEALIKEAVTDGFDKEYECGLDDLWSAIPSQFKQKYIQSWKTVDDIRPKKADPDKNTKNHGRLVKKRQLISDAIASNKWLFRAKLGLTELLDDVDIGDKDGH